MKAVKTKSSWKTKVSILLERILDVSSLDDAEMLKCVRITWELTGNTDSKALSPEHQTHQLWDGTGVKMHSDKPFRRC